MRTQKQSLYSRWSLIFVIIMGVALLQGKGLFSKEQQTEIQYPDGPKKEWSPSQMAKYSDWYQNVMARQIAAAEDDQLLRRQKAILMGNKITTEIWNFGSISSPGNKTTDIVWEGLGYGYEFGPFICAEVEVDSGSHLDAYPVEVNGTTVWKARVISDGLVSLEGERSPDGKEFWAWEPLVYSDNGVPYADPESEYMPVSTDIDRDGDGKPDSWPEGWYNPNIKQYVWPGALKQGSSNSDMESFFVVDDRANREFTYYPFPDDSSRRGLGLEIECRYYQWANPLAEDIIFLIYKVTNKSPKDLTEVIFGMWGDPHIGGPLNYGDDLSFFDHNLNMVYAWDEDGKSDKVGVAPGYFGYKFLESPGNPFDGIDNDEDGMIDEAQDNNIDDDGDWNIDKDDVGVDGVPNTEDEGEGDGVPTAGDQFDIRKPGEPNYEWTDLDESDMVGLTGFSAPPFVSQNKISNDHYVYENFLNIGVFDSANSNSAGDYVFIYSSGKIDLPAYSSRRFSIALLIGQNYSDLTLNAVTAQDIYEKNYQFAKPPEKPTVTAVPGDSKITLYWDDVAEASVDPISEKKDFEGYVIYRSIDPQFADQQNITDSYGSSFMLEPLELITGAPAKFDLDNEYFDLSSVPFPGRGVFYNLGNNTGLRHSFVDSNKVDNGQNYYYAVVSYDHGDDSLMIPPTECSRTITLNPETNEVILDINTIKIMPRAPAAGFTEGHVEANAIDHIAGYSTANVDLEIIDTRMLEEDNLFEVTFKTAPTRYSVEDLKPVKDTIYVRLEQYVRTTYEHLNDTTFVLSTLDGSQVFQDSIDYVLIPETGQFLACSTGALQDREYYLATYRYFPVIESELLNMEENNPVFDGVKIYAKDVTLDLDTNKTGWTATSYSNWVGAVKPYNNIITKKYPADYEIRFFDTLVDSSSQPGKGFIKCNFEIWDVTPGRLPTKNRMVILEITATKDSLFTPGERVAILLGDTLVVTTWEFTFTYPTSGDTIAPGAGDVFYIATSRPFTSEDVYQFTTVSSKIDPRQAKIDLDDINVIPNPYNVTNTLEQLDHQNPRDRGPRRLYFNNLPRQCTIRIYTISGELVRVLEHDAPADNGIEYWDLTTRDNFPIAYGVYIYHVDAGDLGEKIGRFGVIK
ncbi:MAG: hypothetical protein ABIA75_05180 [Candidatus Neomarinimicrobiota bacterium]